MRCTWLGFCFSRGFIQKQEFPLSPKKKSYLSHFIHILALEVSSVKCSSWDSRMQIGVWLYRRHFDTKSVSAILQSNVFIKTKNYIENLTHMCFKNISHLSFVACRPHKDWTDTLVHTQTHAVTPILLSFIISVQNSINNHHATMQDSAIYAQTVSREKKGIYFP